MEATLVPRALPGPSARGKGGIKGRRALSSLTCPRQTPPSYHAYVSSDPRRHAPEFPTDPGDVLYADAAFIVDAHEKVVRRWEAKEKNQAMNLAQEATTSDVAPRV